ncbi:carbon-nitrogen hydrolase family protein [Nocardioides sp. zg-DK7169]|uniref:carbon-nitrogen hydrolase family protein n=1 Tax=Nocardioides sp. zg-DK7169 TaxID=2736600 RepID=UPI00155776B1|nr:carbon-nitrogen hydrolase family protein [Nocardioides sp. zg-DK7169]
MIVAAGQEAAVAGDLAVNAATAARLTEQAGAAGARLLVLPEAFLTGYDEAVFAGPLPDEADLAGPLLDGLRASAAAAGTTVVLGTALQRGPRRTLSSVVVHPDGRTLAAYDKQHLSGYENDHFTPGEHGASVTLDGWELGLSICYDGCFPEHARAAADDGALGYLNGAAYFPGGEHRRDTYYPARALDNGFFVVFSGLTGRCGSESFIGGSAVYDPEGRPLARLGTEPGLAVATLSRDLLAATRAAHPMHRDHRPSLGPRARV